MNCKQKSGVFLNIACQNAKAHSCTNCKKEVCETHMHVFRSKHLCEDCYWENYLFALNLREDDYIEENYLGRANESQSSQSSTGFRGGFGGGSFSGGGASGSWTEGDKQSLSDSNNAGNALLSDDDTFFYS